MKWILINVTNWLKYIIIGEGNFWFRAMAWCQTFAKTPWPYEAVSVTIIDIHRVLGLTPV